MTKVEKLINNIEEGEGWASLDYINRLVDLSEQEKIDVKLMLAKYNMLYFTENDDNKRPDHSQLLSVENVIKMEIEDKYFKEESYKAYYDEEYVVIELNENVICSVVYNISARPGESQILSKEIVDKTNDPDRYEEMMEEAKSGFTTYLSQNDIEIEVMDFINKHNNNN